MDMIEMISTVFQVLSVHFVIVFGAMVGVQNAPQKAHHVEGLRPANEFLRSD